MIRDVDYKCVDLASIRNAPTMTENNIILAAVRANFVTWCKPSATFPAQYVAEAAGVNSAMEMADDGLLPAAAGTYLGRNLMTGL